VATGAPLKRRVRRVAGHLSCARTPAERMRIFRPLVTLAAVLILASGATAAPLSAQVREPAAPADTARPAPRRELPRILMPPSPERARRMMIGAAAGALTGASAGAVYGYTRADRHCADCLSTPQIDAVLLGLTGMGAGGLAGALVGAVWPGGRASHPAVGAAPAGAGARITVTFTH
jgi:hypothetical protein